MAKSSKYPDCDHIKRPVFHNAESKDVIKEIAKTGFEVLPLYEKSIFVNNTINHYSLKNNEFINCRWISFKRNFATRVHVPFQFVDVRDYHFYNCKNRFLPEESIHTKQDYRFKLKPGPGVDFRGQMPIPQDFFMKRGGAKKDKDKKHTRKSHGDKKGAHEKAGEHHKEGIKK